MDDAGEAAAAERIGRDVLGPIFAEFAVRLWMLQFFHPDRDRACLLFCARGGLRLRLIYDRFLAAGRLAPPLPHADLMVSRLVAARTAIAAPGPALLDELHREFAGRPMREVAAALAQTPADALPPRWDEPFDPQAFAALLREPAGTTAAWRADVLRLDAAFRRHLAIASRGRPNVILCDTGLYGSTVRLLAEAIPETRWIAAQFARSNYKALPVPHFAVTVGLGVERDGYAPWNARTGVLRFWHLIEAVLEPELESVRLFTDDPAPRANLQQPGWRERIPPRGPGLFGGILAHIDGLAPADLPGIDERAANAWRALRRMIVRPGPRDLRALTLQPRARDFGRSEAVLQFPEGGSVRASLWREGAVVRRYRTLRPAALALLETAHTARALRRLARHLRR